MASSVYSRQFFAWQGLNGHGTTIVVPTGTVYIVKQVTIYANGLLGTVRTFFRDLDSGATLFTGQASEGVPSWFGFYGALVFEPGASFRFEVSAIGTDGADVYAGGYSLSALT